MDGQPIDKLAARAETDLAEIAAGLTEIAVDRDAEVPIGVQLAWALRSRIGGGELAPGQRLPGLRELAEATGVNVNTVRAVYQRLEQEGLIDSQQGSGTFVAPTSRRPSAVKAIAASAAREARDTGVDPRAVAAALYTSTEPPAGPEEEAAARRRRLRAQIGVLERTLGEIEAEHPGVAPQPVAARASIGPALLSAAELEQVRTALVRRLSVVQSAIDASLAAADGQADHAVKVARSRRATRPAARAGQTGPSAGESEAPAARAKAPAKPRRSQPRAGGGGGRPAPAGA